MTNDERNAYEIKSEEEAIKALEEYYYIYDNDISDGKGNNEVLKSTGSMFKNNVMVEIPPEDPSIVQVIEYYDIDTISRGKLLII